MEELLATEVYYGEKDENFVPSSDLPVLVLSNSWEDFVNQMVGITAFNLSKVRVKTDSGLSIASFSTLKYVASKSKFALRFYGKKNQQAIEINVYAEQASLPTPVLAEEGSRPQQNGSEDSLLLQPLPVAADVNSMDSLIEVIDLGEHYHVPGILKKMRVTQVNSSIFPPEKLIHDLVTAPTYQYIKLLRKGVGRWLMLNCNEKYYPTRAEYKKMAIPIVHYFPLTGNKNLSVPWDIFFDPTTGLSQVEHYVRCKRSRDGLSKKRDACKRSRNDNSSQLSEEGMRAIEIDLRREKLTNLNKKQFLQKLQDTLPLRTRMRADNSLAVSAMVKRYPILVECFDAADQELKSLVEATISTFVQNWRRLENQLVSIAEKELRCAASKTYLQKWSAAIDDFGELIGMNVGTHLVLHFVALLLPNQRYAVKGEDNADRTINTLYQEFNSHRSKSDILKAEEAKMGTIGILKIDTVFHVKIDGDLYTLASITQLDEAIAYLVALHFIFHNNYPPLSKFVYGFLERLFKKNPTVRSRVIDLLIEKLRWNGGISDVTINKHIAHETKCVLS